MTTDTPEVQEVLGWNWRHGEMARGATSTSYYPMLEQLTGEDARAKAAKLNALGIESIVLDNRVGHLENGTTVYHDDSNLEVRNRESIKALAALGCSAALDSVNSWTAPMRDYYIPNSAHR